MADSLENLFHLLEKAVVIDRDVQPDDTEVTRTFSLILFAGRASKVSIDSTEMRIVRASLARSEPLIIPADALDHKGRKIVIF
jgi:hypothetical protein